MAIGRKAYWCTCGNGTGGGEKTEYRGWGKCLPWFGFSSQLSEAKPPGGVASETPS